MAVSRRNTCRNSCTRTTGETKVFLVEQEFGVSIWVSSLRFLSVQPTKGLFAPHSEAFLREKRHARLWAAPRLQTAADGRGSLPWKSGKTVQEAKPLGSIMQQDLCLQQSYTEQPNLQEPAREKRPTDVPQPPTFPPLSGPSLLTPCKGRACLALTGACQKQRWRYSRLGSTRGKRAHFITGLCCRRRHNHLHHFLTFVLETHLFVKFFP